jgi:hypothetical protein
VGRRGLPRPCRNGSRFRCRAHAFLMGGGQMRSGSAQGRPIASRAAVLHRRSAPLAAPFLVLDDIAHLAGGPDLALIDEEAPARPTGGCGVLAPGP